MLKEFLYNAINYKKIHGFGPTEFLLRKLDSNYEFIDAKTLHALYDWGEAYNEISTQPFLDRTKYYESQRNIMKSFALHPDMQNLGIAKITSELQYKYRDAIHLNNIRAEASLATTMPYDEARSLATSIYVLIHRSDSEL